MGNRRHIPSGAWSVARGGCWRRALVAGLAAVLLVGLAVAPARGEAEDKKEKIAPPVDVKLPTKDGLVLVATYYASHQGKNAVPVILLHGLDGSRRDLASLALKLQAIGHAVIVPDLRGHGESADLRKGARGRAPLPSDYAAMVTYDVEAVKNYLIDRNNAGELNIEKLCLVGVEMGASVALNFAARDWSFPTLATGKQGQDVKALVLVSPRWSFHGLRINEAVAHPNVSRDLSVLIVAGDGTAKVLQDAKRLHGAFERFHPAPPPEAPASRQTLWLRTPPTSLQGTRLVNEKSMLVDQMIDKFIELRLVDAAIPWRERRDPLE